MSDTTGDRTFKGWVRPLSLASLWISPFEHLADELDAHRVLQDLCNDWTAQTMEGIKARFLQVDTPELDIFIVPSEDVVLEKLVWPLRHAKIAFCTSDFIGCIAICGMVCEMAAMFLYEVVGEACDLSQLDPTDQKIFSEKKYEGFGQQRRIRGLARMRVIPKALGEALDEVRKIRREYLHFLTKDHSKIEDDACETYKASCHVVKALVAIPIGEKGKFQIPSHLERYMRSKGIIEPENS